jgi:hypothetical protein
MHRHVLLFVMLGGVLSGCSSGGGVSTASILGNAPTPPAAGAAPGTTAVAIAPTGPTSTPTERAFQVGTVSARAAKCGYNFDAAKLKNAYLAHEASLGSTGENIAQVEKIYNVAYSGVTKASAEDPNYCSERKTETIKADLGRLLAGDFEPPKKPAVVAKQDGGLFDGWFDSSGVDSGPTFGSGDWWESQKEKAGN